MIIIVPQNNQAAARLAARNGCRPFYWEPYEAWCCGCLDNLHAMDQQCSAISQQSARRRTKP